VIEFHAVTYIIDARILDELIVTELDAFIEMLVLDVYAVFIVEAVD
jgi:hypothetical protein